MLEVVKETVRGVPVLKLEGRLDSYGANLFDREAGSLVLSNAHVILDLSGIEYLSSLGIRSLMTLHKGLKSASGGLILTGLNPFVSQVLELSGLLNLFVFKDSVEQALDAVLELGACEVLGEMPLKGGPYNVLKFSSRGSAVDIWGVVPGSLDPLLLEDCMISVSMEDLGFCFGLGGFGHTRAQAAECPGLFVSAGRLAGLMPADSHGVPDFLVVERPAESFVQVISGVGFSGEPLFCMEFLYDEDRGLETILGDSLEAAGMVSGGRASSPLGVVIVGESSVIKGSRYSDIAAMAAGRSEPVDIESGGQVLLVGAAKRAGEAPGIDETLKQHLYEDLETRLLGNGICFSGHGIGLFGDPEGGGESSLLECISSLADLERVRTVFRVEPGTRISRGRVWVFEPSDIRAGEDKLLNLVVEGDVSFHEAWESITRRLYSDAGRVVLRPIHGGYMATTFEVDSYGRDGRRWIPTVLKIASSDVSRREEAAFHKYVEKTILNNSTAIMGSAGHGEWVGLRYNFVGIGGPNSRLSWLADNVRARPAKDLIPIFKKLFTEILKPWYGQPRWEDTFLFEEHDPRSLFPRIGEDARKALNIDIDSETIFCEPLGATLPNPYRFLEKEYERRRREGRLWYRSICHGDLNMQNVLLDEMDNIYVIDYSETGPRNVISDFARLEAILKIEMTRLDDKPDLEQLVFFEKGLCGAPTLDSVASFEYGGTDPMVAKIYELIVLLRALADRVTVFETDMIPYRLALLQWTLPVVSYQSAGMLRKLFACYSAGLLVKNILESQGINEPGG